jgi:type IV pilus assembly protein PilE
MSVGTMARSARGVTLIELMIAVAIVGILAAVAYPSYQAQVRRANRTEAKAELMEATQELEKCYTRYGSYVPTAPGLCVAYDRIAAGTRTSENGKYAITFAGAPTNNAYNLQATPQANRFNDPECGALQLNQSGQRNQTMTGATTARCW